MANVLVMQHPVNIQLYHNLYEMPNVRKPKWSLRIEYQIITLSVLFFVSFARKILSWQIF